MSFQIYGIKTGGVSKRWTVEVTPSHTFSRTEGFRLLQKYLKEVWHRNTFSRFYMEIFWCGKEQANIFNIKEQQKEIAWVSESTATPALRSTATAKCCWELRCEASPRWGASPSSSGHAWAELWQTAHVQSKFTSHSTACTVTPCSQQHCTETLRTLSSQFKTGSWNAKSINCRTRSKPLPGTCSCTKFQLHEHLVCAYACSHSAHGNYPLLILLRMGILGKVFYFLWLLQSHSKTEFLVLT